MNQEKIFLDNECLKDPFVRVEEKQLEQAAFNLSVDLQSNNKLIDKMIAIAFSDIESNMVEDNEITYFGAGRTFGKAVFTRDISLSGVLSLNKYYPKVMLDSLKYTRQARRHTGFDVDHKDYIVEGIQAPWRVTEDNPYHCGSITRRSDDVIWLWGMWDLIQEHQMLDQIPYLYETGKWFFENIYDYFYDDTDGLYRGQAVFVDVHFPHMKSNGYPLDWTISDCVRIKALSTNAVYKHGLDIMAKAADYLGLEEKAYWLEKSSHLKKSIIKHLSLEDKCLSYYKDGSGQLSLQKDALGIAFAILHDVVDDELSKVLLNDYPMTPYGIPLLSPFFKHVKVYKDIPVIHDGIYHNLTTWGFVDAFYLQAYEKAYQMSTAATSLKMIGRMCMASSFYELVDFNTKLPIGSSHQLWTAASFINAADRLDFIRRLG
ncbi:hypothetical protein EZV73_08515 [Acidaminobacter sp. JC074]|uniref:amylo-alpha-1,6-glucosidase n=1 Tax=Acidaminobacter sp. JC074 TaxID=2530199 RepID=UPI001F0E6FE0|nr:amylo-alpha-1,6-glucosidase [Acidaminobacter sp. JC074]MCH4887613.1 hypothetical protein [Acidaminobacter sp. JC074]